MAELHSSAKKKASPKMEQLQNNALQQKKTYLKRISHKVYYIITRSVEICVQGQQSTLGDDFGDFTCIKNRHDSVTEITEIAVCGHSSPCHP